MDTSQKSAQAEKTKTTLGETLNKIQDAGFEIWTGVARYGYTGGGIHGRYTEKSKAVQMRRVYAPDDSGAYIHIDDDGFIVNKGLNQDNLDFFLRKTNTTIRPKISKREAQEMLRAMRNEAPSNKELTRLACTLTDQQIVDLEIDVLADKLWSTAKKLRKVWNTYEMLRLEESATREEQAIQTRLRALPGWPKGII